MCIQYLICIEYTMYVYIYIYLYIIYRPLVLGALDPVQGLLGFNHLSYWETSPSELAVVPATLSRYR